MAAVGGANANDDDQGLYWKWWMEHVQRPETNGKLQMLMGTVGVDRHLLLWHLDGARLMWLLLDDETDALALAHDKKFLFQAFSLQFVQTIALSLSLSFSL